MISRSSYRRAVLPALLALFLPALPGARAAGSATWNTTATSGVWYTNTNWTPAVVPNTIADTATFGVSNITAISFAPGGFNSNLGSFVFNPGASAYVITFSRDLYFTSTIAAGVVNDSGILQSFIVPLSSEFRDQNQLNNTVAFAGSATAGALTKWTVGASGSGAYRPAELIFNDEATGASANFVVTPGGSDIGGEDGDGYGGILDFRGTSTADHATITVTGGAAGADFGAPPVAYFTDSATAANAAITTTGGTIPLAYGGELDFYGNSTAAYATITNQGGAVNGGRHGQTTFSDSSTAANATLIAAAGAGGADGGLVQFYSDSTGGTARCEVFGNGMLDISGHATHGVSIGSLEGDGVVSLGTKSLTVGSNGLSTEFSGTIQATTDRGSLTKVGIGTLTLSGVGLYSGLTTVQGGKLLINNATQSATGTGPIRVGRGLLGGNGMIAGEVTVGGGRGGHSSISPGSLGDGNTGTLLLQSALTFAASAIYNCQLDSAQATYDTISANGVTITEGARFLAGDLGAGAYAVGTQLTVIDNTSALPISGTFTNLADGSVITVRSRTARNNFQVSYEGGDGNDLTLTVVP